MYCITMNKNDLWLRFKIILSIRSNLFHFSLSPRRISCVYFMICYIRPKKRHTAFVCGANMQSRV